MKKIILTLITILLTTVVFSQSVNDLCSGATVASQTGGCTAGSIVSGDNDNAAGCNGCQATPCNQHQDVWYTFVSTGTSFAYNLTGGTLINGEILLVSATGPCAGMAVVNSTCGALPLSGTFTGLVNGATYYVVISAPSNQTGTFNLCTTVSTPAGNQDCSNATQVCSNSPFAGNSSGFGTAQELNASNQGCLTVEHQSSWYIIQIQTSGTLNMTIAPAVGVDYDYALWGPASACPPTAPPIRCSFASGFSTNFATGSYNTGIGAPGTEPSDGTGGTLDGWSNTLNVTAGQVYILLIDNFTANGTPFNLNWGGTASLNCSPLPIELLAFNGVNNGPYNLLTWSTATEINNDYFTLERSSDGYNWTEVSRIDGAGNSSQTLSYSFKDFSFKNGLNYYRLTQTDYNGQHETFNIIVVDNYKESPKVLRTTNLIGQEVSSDFEGLRIVYYSDGTTVKKSGK